MSWRSLHEGSIRKRTGHLSAATAAHVFHDAEAEAATEEHAAEVPQWSTLGVPYVGCLAFGSMSQRLGISPGRGCERNHRPLLGKFPSIKAYMDRTVEQARERGYVETLLGRRRYLPDIQSANGTIRAMAERNAINSPIQGSAADMIKAAMVLVWKAFSRNPSHRV